MSFFIVIRGPAGAGKSTIARQVAAKLGTHYVSFDDVLAAHGLDVIEGDGISAANFIKGNEQVLPEATAKLAAGVPVVFDGCFYRKEQLEHLESNLPGPHFVFSLQLPLEECLRRNRLRPAPMPDGAVSAVYKMVGAVEIGEAVETIGKSAQQVAAEICQRVSGMEITP